ncbi:MAG: gliding motility-associated transporter ATP-binding subunit GldA [Bacteroidota bacterium]|jgi:ABC-2 type transport system ATP-binding protein
MSIEVNKISKKYGSQLAVNNMSFAIGKGEVVGFLGPNGAGKSTMMKIITCYLPPTSGDAKVCGFDVMHQGIEARKRIGYLPEHNPLYTDMYVREYLAFIADIYKLKGRNEKVKGAIDQVGLEVESHKKIGALSKGYRQRVGLAAAIIHDPEVLILDEPTSGLDPNQLVDIRDLIITLGKEKTVMLSTHIMQEVEAICGRTIIINKGEVMADEATSNLRQLAGGESYELTVEFSGAMEADVVKRIKGVVGAHNVANRQWVIRVAGSHDVRKEIAELAMSKGLVILTMTRNEVRLEEIFKTLTAVSKS